MTDSSSSEPLVVARIRGDKPTFTPVLPFKELFDAVQDKLPVDKVYIVQEGSGGYAFREVGALMVTFQAIGESLPPPEPPAPPTFQPKEKRMTNEQPKKEVKKAPKKKVVAEPVTPPADAKKTMAGSMTVDTFTPAQPSQAKQFLDERLGFD